MAALTINPALLIAAPILQDYFSDNATDAAMSDGVITCYQDNSRTTLKNWYYQSGSPGAYTYVTLDNPLTLSAAGTITDPNGNDTIPFWYPYSETDNITPQPYYVTVDNSNGQRQFTRQNFPFNPGAGGNTALTSTLRNLIVNNVFWRNQGTVTLTNSTQSMLAPSQHDGFVANMSDIQFVKNATGSTDVATFTQFTNLNRLGNNDPTPEFYLNMSCGNTGGTETIKYIQIPICLHVDNLSGQANCSVTIWTQNPMGGSNNVITLNLFQFQGTGAVSPAATTLITINPSSTWQKTVVPFDFPVATLPTTGPGDDGWFLQIGFPVGVTYNMNIAKPSVYLSKSVPSDDFDTYEVVSGTIDAPRTGDIRTSLNSFFPFGWVPMNSGTIGNANSNATSRANIDTWPLYSLIWNLFHPYNTSGTTNLIAQLVNSSNSNVAYGASAVADFNANNAITLSNTMSKVILGGSPFAALLNTNEANFTASNSGGNLLITPANPMNLYSGAPVQFINSGGPPPGGLIADTIYYVSNFNSGSSTFFVSTTFSNALNSVVLPFVSSGSGTNIIISTISGTFEGEYAHILLKSELPNPITQTANIVGAAAGGNSVISNSASFSTGTVSNQGGNTPHNVTQPGVYMNLYMKL